jgi:DNA-binding winged helix-turn-helix (wHTH) protein
MSNWKIGGVIFDPFTYQFGEGEPLSEAEAKLLELLIANRRYKRKRSNEEMVRSVWGSDGKMSSLYQAIVTLRNRLGGPIERFIATGPYRLMVEPEEIDGSAVSSTFPPDEQIENSKWEFDLVIDGMIINSCGELLLEDPETTLIRGACASSYERSLEDLAFVAVYANRLVSGKDFRPSLTTPDQPGKEVAGNLGSICVHRPFPLEITNARLLLRKDFKEKIRSDIQVLARCASERRYVPFFRDYMVREAAKHLGESNTLFQDDLDPARYEFNVGRAYYTDDELQQELAGAADVFIGYLPLHPPGYSERYAKNALREFVTRNTLSLITIMWEADEFARRSNAWRMPHAVRTIIMANRHSAGRGIDQQEILRSLVVEHALTAALKHMRRKNRSGILATLLSLRDDQPFKAIRELLNREHLVFIEPGAKREENARKVYRQIRKLIGSDLRRPDTFQLSQGATLREFTPSRSSEYESELYRVFPELRPARI